MSEQLLGLSLQYKNLRNFQYHALSLVSYKKICVYWKKIFKKQCVSSFISFVFIFLLMLGWISSSSIHLNKNVKTKENCFKNCNARKVILNKKTNLQVMYVREFRASILASKDQKINTETLKILVFLLILFFSVFRPLGLFTLCSHATKSSSLSTSVVLSYVLKVLSYKYWNK